MKRGSMIAASLLFLLVVLLLFVLAPVFTIAVGAPVSFGGKTVLPTANVSPSYYYLGFGVMSIDLCGHQSLFFLWNRGYDVSCAANR